MGTLIVTDDATSLSENPREIASQWIITLQVKKETEFWELGPYAEKAILSMDQYKKNKISCDQVFSIVMLLSLKAQSTSAPFSVQHVFANKQNLCVCKMPKTIHFFKRKRIWKIGNLFPGVQEATEIEFKNHLSHRLFHCCLSHAEEICFINNV